MKGGIMCLQLETENCKFKFVDSFKMIQGSLDELCESYNVPE